MKSGQKMIRGTRIPPSYGNPLPDLNGALFVTPNNPPLSEVNIINVLSKMPSSFKIVTILPTAWSTLSTIVA